MGEILVSLTGTHFQKSHLIDTDYYLYFPIRQHQNYLRFQRLAWAWSRARLHREWENLQAPGQPRLQQGRLLTLQCLGQDLAAIEVLAADLPPALVPHYHALRAALIDLITRCQQRLDQLALPPPPAFQGVPRLGCSLRKHSNDCCSPMTRSSTL